MKNELPRSRADEISRQGRESSSRGFIPGASSEVFARKNKLFWFSAIILGILLAIFFGRNTPISNQPNSENKLQITTSFYPLYFFSSQITQNKANIKNLTPSGAEPHDYEPTTQDIANLEKSNLVIINGSGLEPWVGKIMDDLKSKNIKIVIASENPANQDPHLWLDPVLVKKMAQNILDGLLKVDPSNKDFYQTNSNNLQKKLDNLNNQYQQGLINCQRRDFITSHEAFGYLAKEYNLKQIPISGLSPDEEPSPKKLSEIAKFARENNVKHIFFESLVSPKLAETIASEVGAQTLVLDPIEGLSDEDTKKGEDYFTKMQDNLKNLRIALQCQ